MGIMAAVDKSPLQQYIIKPPDIHLYLLNEYLASEMGRFWIDSFFKHSLHDYKYVSCGL